MMILGIDSIVAEKLPGKITVWTFLPVMGRDELLFRLFVGILKEILNIYFAVIFIMLSLKWTLSSM